MSPFQLNTKVLIGAIAGGGLVLYVLYSMFGTSSENSKNQKTPSGHLDDRTSDVLVFNSWKHRNFDKIPGDVKIRAKSIKVQERYHEFQFEGKNIRIFYLEAGGNDRINKRKTTVLLLHGMKFSSKNWNDIKTISLIAGMGYRVAAVDLPGYGKSKTAVVQDKGAFLEEFIKRTGLGRPVIVSPSMSGSFSLPYLLGGAPEECADKAAGFIPVAPALSDAYPKQAYKKCQTPVMIVYGSDDTGLGANSLKYLRNFANREYFDIKDAGHACYLEKPDHFHKLVYNFLAIVDKS